MQLNDKIIIGDYMRYCKKCGHVIDGRSEYCEECGTRNRKPVNMFIYFIFMLVIFALFQLASNYTNSFFFRIIGGSSYGSLVTIESIWALTIFVVMVLAGNTYIFRRRRVSIISSILLAIPPLIVSAIYMRNFIWDAIMYNSTDVLCIALYCLMIGIAEEFLCRGWILTEFIERYGNDRKHIRLSILASAIIFSLMHILNIFAGQDVFSTVMQVIQTLGLGYLLGVIFYRTRNIWSCVLIHAIFDFSIILSELGVFDACSYSKETTAMYVIGIITSILYSSIYVAYAEILFRKTKVNHLLPNPKKLTEKDERESYHSKIVLTTYIIIALLGYLTAMSNYPDNTIKCENYPKKELPSEYYIITANDEDNTIEYKDKSISIVRDESDKYSYFIVDNNSGIKENLFHDVDKVLLIQNKNYFVISAHNYKDKKIYYYQGEYDILENNHDIINTIISSMITFISPTLNSFETISYKYGEDRYVYFTSNEIKEGMIDGDKQLYELIEK